MSITIEAVYEDGVLKPLSPLPDISERERVLITIQPQGAVDSLQGRIKIDPAVAKEIVESADHSLLEP
jgi:predicted DNA-binding antitoxin AbrB/MazE fold protein